MAKVKGVRERVHQPFYDSLMRGVGITTVSNQFQLFGSANVGQPDLTNMPQAAALPADSTYVIKAIRCLLWFSSLADADWNVAFGSLPAFTNSLGDMARALDCYMMCAYGAYFTLTVGVKPMINGPLWYIPAGGGIAGFTTVNNRSIAQNGAATHEAILKLAKDVHVPARQNFTIQVNFFPFTLRGAGQGGTIPATPNPLDQINQFDGFKLVQFHVDGVQTRDVQLRKRSVVSYGRPAQLAA